MAAPPTFRLDTLAVHLATRLEATRRAHLDDPDAARAAFARVVETSAAALAAECRDVLGDLGQAALIEREARETFLPRYTRLALERSARERRGFAFVFGDGLVARALVTVLVLTGAALLSRYLPGPLRGALFLVAATTPIVPELRAAWARRRWNAQLQELADDLGLLQNAADILPTDSATAPAVSPRSREEAR